MKIWPVSHVEDSAHLYAKLLECMLQGKDINHNQNGYYLASSGTVAWADIYASMAKALAKRGVVDSATVEDISEESLDISAKVLGCSKEFVPFQMGGR